MKNRHRIINLFDQKLKTVLVHCFLTVVIKQVHFEFWIQLIASFFFFKFHFLLLHLQFDKVVYYNAKDDVSTNLPLSLALSLSLPVSLFGVPLVFQVNGIVSPIWRLLVQTEYILFFEGGKLSLSEHI